MRSMQRLVKALDCMNAPSAEAARPKVRRAPACELLEGRQLLNAAWTPPQGFGGWDGAAAKAGSAHVHTLDAKGHTRQGMISGSHAVPTAPGTWRSREAP